MSFRNLKVTCIQVEGNCGRSKVGQEFFIRNAKLVLPPNQNICIFALGSILQPISAAIIDSKDSKGILDRLDVWQCPDALAKVVWKIEEESTDHLTVS